MSIEQTNEVDFIGIDNTSGNVILTISDHLDWTDAQDHLRKLQEKLNTYIHFCESEELYESYPNAVGRRVVFSLVAKHLLHPEGKSFLAKAKTAVEEAGFGLHISSPDRVL